MQQTITTKKLSQNIAAKTSESTFNQVTIQDVLENFKSQFSSYQDFEYVGHGFNSLILRANNNGKQVALKIVQYQKNSEQVNSVKKEYEYLQSLSKSSYFVAVNCCFYLIDKDEEEENLKNKYFVIDMEICSCTLSQFLCELRQEKQQLDGKLKEIIVIQALDALNMLHNKEILHRDIKPTNILINKKNKREDIPFVIKLSDLGLASQLSASKSKSFLSGKGTLNYMALEAQNGQQRKESDLFSLGITFLELDNFQTFESSSIDNYEFSLLQRNGVSALSKHELNRNSLIFEIAKTFLDPNYKQRQSAELFLVKLLSSGKYSHVPVYSIITKESVSRPSQLVLPERIKKNQLLQKNNFNLSTQGALDNQGKLQDLMYQSKSQIQKIESINYYELSTDMIKFAIKALYNKNKFSLFSYLGRGTSGIVFAVKNITEKRESVIKICLGADKVEILRQVSVMKRCQSPYIVKLYGYEIFKDEREKEFVYFEFERCKYSLSQYLEQNQVNINKSPELKLLLALQIMDSVNTLHRQNILHGDIKLDNFLINEDANGKISIKLTDFDQSGILDNLYYHYDDEDQQKYKGYLRTEINCLFLRDKQGTPAYRSPERWIFPYPSTFLSDSFSVGLCLLFLENYQQFNLVYFKNQTQLHSPYEVPFKNFNFFNKNSQIYQWAISLLAYHPHQRLLLREIIDNISDSQNPILHSKIFSKPLLQKTHIESSFLFMKGIKQLDISQLFNLNSAATFQQNLQSLTLYLSSNQISHEDVISLSSVLSKLTLLSTLTLSISENKVTNGDLKQLSSVLSELRQLSSLTLYLYKNQISSEGVFSLSSALSKLKSLSSLTLSLSENQITSGGLTFLSSFLSTLNELSSLAIYLSENQITSEGVISLSYEISKLNKLLNLTLDLSSNQITSQGAISLSQSISTLSQLQSLTLSLSSNQIISEDKIQFPQGLSKLNQLATLTYSFSKNKIGSSGIEQLSSELQQLNKILCLTLFLYNNQIKSDGVQLLSSSLSQLQLLSSLTLSLSENQIAEGITSLSQALLQLNQLQSLTLYLQRSQITNKEVTSLQEGILKLSQLSSLTLSLSENKITIEGYSSLASVLSQMKDLSRLTLDMRWNKISLYQDKGVLRDLINLKNDKVSKKTILL